MKINIDDDAVEFIARRSAGGLRDALALLDQSTVLALENKAITISGLVRFLSLLIQMRFCNHLSTRLNLLLFVILSNPHLQTQVFAKRILYGLIHSSLIRCSISLKRILNNYDI